MKKLRTLLVTTALVMVTAVTSFAGDITVKVNGSKVNFPDVKPYTDQNDRTLVPIRFIADNLGAETSWNEEKQIATIKKDDKTIDICIRCKKIFVNGKQVETDSIGEKKDDIRTMVPLRFISEMFGAKVGWDEKTLTVTIDTELPNIPTPNVPEQTEMKEISTSVLPKDVYNKFQMDRKLYDGAGLQLNARLGNTDKTGFVICTDIYDEDIVYAVLTDGTWIRGNLSFHGNYIGKEVDKLYIVGDSTNGFKNFLVDIPNIKIKEQWRDGGKW